MQENCSFSADIIVENLKVLKFEIIGKDACQHNPEDPSYEFLKILNMGSISIKNMGCHFCNVQIKYLRQ